VKKPKNSSVAAMGVATHITTSAPLPTAVEFSGYERTLPGAAERILLMAEKEQQARIELGNKEQEYKILAHNREQDNQFKNSENARYCNLISMQIYRIGIVLQTLLPFVVCMTAIIAGVFLMIHGYDKTGGGLIWTALASIISTYIKKEFFPNKNSTSNQKTEI
jgi:uncharacterized membrane protein